MGSNSNVHQSGSGDQNSNIGPGLQANFHQSFHNHPIPAPDPAEALRQEKEACLGSLSFPNIEARLNDIEHAHPKTCEWLFSTAEFREWRDRAELSENHGVLWLKGKAGSGKSTLMKHTWQYSATFFKDHVRVPFFFNARSHDTLEKSPTGLIRSIIYHMVDKDNALYQEFIKVYRTKKIQNDGKPWEWQWGELREFLYSQIQRWKSGPCLLLIDALDECEEEEVSKVVKLLENLSRSAVEARLTLRICLSSRHFPNITMKKYRHLIVEKCPAHNFDLETYIKEELIVTDIVIYEQILHKADGIFLWVILVVGLLNTAHNQGKPEAMQEALKNVPEGLEELFQSILDKGDSNKAETILMLQWVMLSGRALLPEELYFAVKSGWASGATAQIHGPYINDTIIQNYILNTSKGLVELRKEPKWRKDTRATVQFIHKSVDDFLSRQKRLSKLDASLEPDPITASHVRLWECCKRCIDQQDIKGLDAKGLMALGGSNPFLRYAVDWIFQHAEMAMLAVSRPEPIMQWLRQLDIWFVTWTVLQLCCGQKTRRLGSYLMTGREKSRTASHLKNLMDTLSARDHKYLMHALLDEVEMSIEFKAQVSHWKDMALCVAVLYDQEDIATMLLQSGANANARHEIHGNCLEIAARRADSSMVQALLGHGANPHTEGGPGGNALQVALYFGNYETAEILLNAGADINAATDAWINPLQAALCSGHQHSGVVEMLLDRGPDTSAHGGEKGIQLLLAARQGNAQSVIDWLSSLKQQELGSNTLPRVLGYALHVVIDAGGQDLAEMLIENGADVNIQGGSDLGSALNSAMCYSLNPDVAMMLVDDVRVDVNGPGASQGNALQMAARYGYPTIVDFLINEKANVNAQEGPSGSALQLAAENGYLDIAKKLLAAGAEINAPSKHWGNALCRALSCNKWEMAKFLMDHGAELPSELTS